MLKMISFASLKKKSYNPIRQNQPIAKKNVSLLTITPLTEVIEVPCALVQFAATQPAFPISPRDVLHVPAMPLGRRSRRKRHIQRLRLNACFPEKECGSLSSITVVANLRTQN